MTIAEALRIIQALADGQNPISGGRLPEGSPYQHPDVVRALFTAVHALTSSTQRTSRSTSEPANRGQPWTAIEGQAVFDAFDARTSITNLAKLHQRSVGAIKSRLERLGRDIPQPALPARHYPTYSPRSQATPNETGKRLTMRCSERARLSRPLFPASAFPPHAAVAPAAPVAELGVVRRSRLTSMNESRSRVPHSLSAASYPVSAASYLVSAASYLVSAASYLVSAASYPVSAASYPASAASYPVHLPLYPRFSRLFFHVSSESERNV